MIDDKKPKVPPPLPGQKGAPKPPQNAPKPPLNAPKPPLPAGAAAPKPAVPGPKPSPKPSMPARQEQQARGEQAYPVSSEIDEMKRELELQIMSLQSQLQEEKEKLLLQTVRAKEEEAMAAKVEESLKDIQDKLRREKREQELQESLNTAESKIKELEQRLTQERQTWVETLKTQMGQRDTQDRELERNFDLQLKELERRWQEEKLGWSQALKLKEEELDKLKIDFETEIVRERQLGEKRNSQLEQERDAVRRELKEMSGLFKQEKDNLYEKLESRDREFLSLKAQQAMIVTQLRQEKEKHDQLRQLLEKFKAEKESLISQIGAKDKDYFLLKTQSALHQARVKADQEKLLKEIVLYKEQIQKERQQWEINAKAREHELSLLAETSRTRESELRQQLEQKEREFRGQQLQWIERFQAKEREFNSLAEREKNLNIETAQLEQRIIQLQDKLAVASSDLDEEKTRAESFRKETERLSEESKKLELLRGSDALKAQHLENRIKDYGREISDKNIELLDRERELDNLRKEMQAEVRAKDLKIEAERGVAEELKIKLVEGEHRQKDLTQRIEEYIKGLESQKEDFSKKQNEFEIQKQDFVMKLQTQQRIIEEFTAREKDFELKIKDKDGEMREISVGIESIKNELAAREITHKTELSALHGQVHSKDKELASAAAKEVDYKLRIAEIEQKMRDSETRLELGMMELSEQKQEQERVRAQMDLVKEEHKNNVLKLENDLKKAEQDKGDMKAEMARVNALISQLENQNNALKNEIALKEKDNFIHLGQKDTAHAAEIARMKERMQYLEKELNDKNADIRSAVEEYEDEWKRKEEHILQALKEKDGVVDQLKAELSNQKKEKERFLRHQQEGEERNQAELMSVQHKLWEMKEKLAEASRQKEHDGAQIKAKLRDAEESIRVELENKYRQKLSQHEKEQERIKQEVGAEIQVLRDTMRGELNKMEEQLVGERKEWQERVKEKEDKSSVLSRRIEELMAQIREKEEQVVRYGLSNGGQYRVNVTENNGVKISTIERSPQNAGPVVSGLPAKENDYAFPPREEEVDMKESYSLWEVFKRIWKGMNEPIIEIGSRKEEKNK
ncbi:MAG: hypothetical protein JW803_07295 [Endomicrobiales bacterium]|nr:hypothetical protein [Endomicrobiales bacterium]